MSKGPATRGAREANKNLARRAETSAMRKRELTARKKLAHTKAARVSKNRHPITGEKNR